MLGVWKYALELRVALFLHCWLRLNDQPPKAKPGSSKKPAAAPFGVSKGTKAKKNPLFTAKSKNFGIGNHTLLSDLLFLRSDFCVSRSGHSPQDRLDSLRQMAWICSSPTPKSHPPPTSQGPTRYCSILPYSWQKHSYPTVQTSKQIPSRIYAGEESSSPSCRCCCCCR